MPNIYAAGQTIPELRGYVLHGIAVVLHHPSEIAGVEAICEFAPRPPEHPMQSVYRALIEPGLDLAAWADYATAVSVGLRESRRPFADGWTLNENWKYEPRHADPARLQDALAISRDLWMRALGETQEGGANVPDPEHPARTDVPGPLALVVIVADHGPGAKREVEIAGEGAAFVFVPGSILADVAKLPLRATTWATCFVAGGGTSSSARAPGLVQRLREGAIRRANAANKGVLEDIRSVQALRSKKRRLVVLVHGLFATDVGTFDHLEALLDKQKDVDVVGFPHDTVMTAISANGHELAQLIAKLNPATLAVAAHSRGGLVARSALYELAKERAKRNLSWPHPPRCATFGTPHLGAALAESPGKLIAAVVLAGSSLTREAATVLDALTCISENEKLPGIEDLRPSTKRDTWLEKFQKDEGLFPDGHASIRALGGRFAPVSLGQRVALWTARRVLGDEVGDLVVPLSSSRPGLGDPLSSTHEVRSSHFDYFNSRHDTELVETVKFLLP